ncbi:hypothetical protein [Candidatus Liberibacter americanus]|uniref:Uncharacterized protein n=1 Tax=Candidatus Liberibacter americanus str. Sao Paulo TaxID=1261131 RepID=U6B5E0_9HYPH|nr:hypothetical protein [Candidatus Liberibacter americanus]AHA28170.1 hypothetical protein lam_831 [Candidatus Liberibacter americanus str. Sao Paulo]EMS35843.1 hypothetical protein G653_04546 [Candidatus Liberibacter americanus PW_SP]
MNNPKDKTEDKEENKICILEQNIRNITGNTECLALTIDQIDQKICGYTKLQKELQKSSDEYVKECKREINNALVWRNSFLIGLSIYFVMINIYVFCIVFGTSTTIDNSAINLFYVLMVHNACILITPIVSLFKSYGERNKNEYFPPAMRTAMDLAKKKISQITN